MCTKYMAFSQEKGSTLKQIKITNLVLIVLQLSAHQAIPFLHEEVVGLLCTEVKFPSAGRLLPGL